MGGVDNAGRVDGGISTVVNREPLQDWVDRVVASVAPRARYRVAVVNAEADKGVLLVAFEESHLAPHMASDGRDYAARAARPNVHPRLLSKRSSHVAGFFNQFSGTR